MAQPQFKQDPYIKRDPDAKGSPASFVDDALEDAGDLEFRDNDPRFKHVFLTRVPKYVWEQWENIGDDEEITLGTFRQSWSYGPDGSRKDTVGLTHSSLRSFTNFTQVLDAARSTDSTA